MGYKEDIEQIKTDIVGEGRFLEYFMHFDRFYKKYKFIIWGAIIAIIFAIGYNRYVAYMDSKRVDETNQVLVQLLKDPTNQALQNELKGKNGDLYALFTLSQSADNPDALKSVANSGGIIGKMAKYQLASLNKDAQQLQSTRVAEGAILKDLSIMQSAYAYLENNEFEKAKEEVAKLPFDSQFKTNAQLITHYGVGK